MRETSRKSIFLTPYPLGVSRRFPPDHARSSGKQRWRQFPEGSDFLPCLRIGHFRVHVCFLFKASLSAKFSFICEVELRTLRPALKRRQTWTRKWLIAFDDGRLRTKTDPYPGSHRPRAFWDLDTSHSLPSQSVRSSSSDGKLGNCYQSV